MVQEVADFVLYPAFVASVALFLGYGLLQPWWKSTFGRCAALLLFSMALMLGRAVLTLWLGTDYPGRDWVLLVGRVEIFAATAVAFLGLAYQVAKDWRGPRRAGGRPPAPRSPSRYS